MNMMARSHTDIEVLRRNDPRWERLHQIIDGKSLKRGTFKLSSGRTSNYLFQLRQTTMHPEGIALISGIVLDLMKRLNIRVVGGLEIGAVPIASAINLAGQLDGYPVRAFFIRKERKAHGAQELIDGYAVDGAEALIVDDVTTEGGSMLKAIKGLREEYNCPVKWALSIVDREEGAVEKLAANGITLLSVFKKSDFRIDV